MITFWYRRTFKAWLTSLYEPLEFLAAIKHSSEVMVIQNTACGATLNPQPKLNDITISVVSPIFNEERNVRPLVERLAKAFKQMGCKWEVVFALDPSPDNTELEIMSLIEEDYPVRLIRFSRRIGKALSLMAGLEHAMGEACVIIDADLQDPPELIQEMAQKWIEGHKVVIARRRSRKGENFLYLQAASLFYKILDKFSEVEVPRDAGDFRLIDKEVTKHIISFKEKHGFLRGINASVGFSTFILPFDRDPRFSGKTQISWLGAVNIALDGIIPFSRTPVRALFWMGSFMAAITLIALFALGIFSLLGIIKAIEAPTLIGLLIVFVGGLILTGQGVLGEYLVRTYEETRDRPLYIIDKIVESKRAAGLKDKGIES